jgi:hypothetical protein
VKSQKKSLSCEGEGNDGDIWPIDSTNDYEIWERNFDCGFNDGPSHFPFSTYSICNYRKVIPPLFGT